MTERERDEVELFRQSLTCEAIFRDPGPEALITLHVWRHEVLAFAAALERRLARIDAHIANRVSE